MRHSCSAFLPTVLIWALLFDGSHGAQTPDRSAAAPTQAFGLQGQDHWIYASQFTPISGTFTWDLGDFSFWGSRPGAALNNFVQAQVTLPAGAVITDFVCQIVDPSATAQVTASLSELRFDVTSGPLSSHQIAQVSSGIAATPQYTTIFVSGLNHLVRYRDGAQRNVYVADLFTTGPEVRIRACNVRWNRSVSPAPAIATFSDVPIGSAFHPFVEALAAAGITGGCGGGNFCPDATLTRGQMAVFLSAALGLHWPF